MRPPDTHYAGAPVWWAPSAKQDKRLPWLDTVLPRSIDLSAGLAPFEPGERALAVFGVWDAETAEYQRFVVLTPAGETRLLAAPHIEDNRDESGNGAALFPGNGGLSPDGWHLAFAQTSSIELYDLATGNWTTIDTPDWVAEGARWLDAETLLVPGMGSSGSTFGVDGLPVERPGTWDQQAIMLKDKDQPYGPGWTPPIGGAGAGRSGGISSRSDRGRSVLESGGHHRSGGR
ncbi:MAG: hypothetical protein HZY75_09225 [Nocardioidaceae bacterium]|nr:MAG: hypothetical protein HZY75_09225 [Nocardioidaceae bacterium]